MQNMIFIKIYQPYIALKIFDQRRATFHPISAVEILHSIDQLDLGAMNVTTDDAIQFFHPRHLRQGLFVIADMFHGAFGLLFEIRGQRPATKSQSSSDAIEVDVHVEQTLINPRTKPVK